MRTNRDIKQVLLALALLAGLGTYGTLSRAQSEREVFAEAVRDATVSDQMSVARAANEPRVIKITARVSQFSPNQITLKKGQPVTLQLTSIDRKHGFLLRPMKIDTDIKPGKTTEITFTPQVAGTFKAICDHYCGPGHGNMKMKVVVQ
jgi:cytochrome c oxidase subunit II